MKSPDTTSAPAQTSQTAELDPQFQRQIRVRAYELYEQRGGEMGHELDDWLQAEAEVHKMNANRMAA